MLKGIGIYGLSLGALSLATALSTSSADAATQYNLVASFDNATTGYGTQNGRPAFDSAGNMYVTAPYGGANDAGVLDKMAPDGTVTALHTFIGSDGNAPFGGVLIEPTGQIFGTTCAGGTLNNGVLYELDPDGTYTVLHNFDGANDGQCPLDAPIRNKIGTFFGVANQGGQNGAGTIWKLTSAGRLTVLHAIDNADDGEFPSGRMVKGPGGKLYGMTAFGGPKHGGGIYSVTEKGDFHTIALLSYNDSIGGFPTSYFTKDKSGNLYAPMGGGGVNGAGTIVKLAPDNTLSTLHTFAIDANGYLPSGGLFLLKGNLYGVNLTDNRQNACGTLFQVGLDGSFSVPHTFAGRTSDGCQPGAGIAMGPDKFLYGATSGGGANGTGLGDGTIFKFKVTKK